MAQAIQIPDLRARRGYVQNRDGEGRPIGESGA